MPPVKTIELRKGQSITIDCGPKSVVIRTIELQPNEGVRVTCQNKTTFVFCQPEGQGNPRIIDTVNLQQFQAVTIQC